MIDNKVQACQILKKKAFYKIIKRLLDIIIAVIALLVLLIPFCVVAVTIKVDSKGPVFFRQIRVGKGSKPFVCYKFRSMYVTAPDNCSAHTLVNRNKMVTRFGNVLRKTSFDELPQLINVVRGEMSLIGPRPLILSEIWINEEREKKGVYLLQPGITGLAQICGRNKVSDSEKLYFDMYYLKNFSFWLDIKILFGTILYVLLRKDIF